MGSVKVALIVVGVSMSHDSFKDWPQVCEVGTFLPTISVSRLLPDQKRLLWEHLKTFHPDKAKSIALIMSDELALSIIETFGADLVIEEQYVPLELRWLLAR